MKKITIMLVLIISMNIITPVLANETEVTTDISIQRETSLLIQNISGKLYKRLWNQTLNKWVGDH